MKIILLYLSALFITIGCNNCQNTVDERIVIKEGWVVDTEGNPIDSVKVVNFKNEIMTYSNRNGYFKIETEEYKFFQYVFFQKDHYITDSIAYYINIERLGGLKPCIGIDTIVLKEEGK
jgi:lipoprotein